MEDTGIKRRDFIRISTIGLGLTAAPARLAGCVAQPVTATDSGGGASSRPLRPKPKTYDPLLDAGCEFVRPAQGPFWDAKWIWYPGQLSHHLHRKGIAGAMRQCANVGYPGDYRQADSHVYLRRRVHLESATPIRWACPPSRCRLMVNDATGDISRRSGSLGPGDFELVAMIDFSEALPCLIMEGGPCSTGEDWEASIDGRVWGPVECGPGFSDPAVLPDANREWRVRIPPARLLNARGAEWDGNAFHLEAGGAVTLDFHHDELGTLTFDVTGDGQCALALVVGESVREVESSSETKVQPVLFPGGAQASSVIEVGYSEQWPLPAVPALQQATSVELPERCARFVHVRSTGACTIRNLALNARVHPVEYKGSFECSDERLNSIWSCAAATIHSNMHDFYLDGIRRDVLPWCMDAAMGLSGGDYIFFDEPIARQSLVSLMLPRNPTVENLGIIDFSLHLLFGYEHDHAVRGDLRFIERYWDSIQDILDLYRSLQDSRGFLSARATTGRSFLPDWSTTRQTGPDLDGTPAYAQMMLMHGFEIGHVFGSLLNDEEKGRVYGKAAADLRRAIVRTFWDDAQGFFVNGFHSSGGLDRRGSSFAQVFAVLYELAPKTLWPSMFEKVLDNPARRAPNWSLGQCYEFEAYARAGRMEQLLDRMRRVWGQMLEQRGYTRFIEDIRPADSDIEQLRMYGRPYGNSLCHSWAGVAPVIGLMQGVLGVRASQPGFKACLIEPQLPGLAWAKGTVPTPNGTIKLDVRQKGAAGSLELPAGIVATPVGCRLGDGETTVTGPGRYRLTLDR